jgi:hypothetical protein
LCFVQFRFGLQQDKAYRDKESCRCLCAFSCAASNEVPALAKPCTSSWLREKKEVWQVHQEVLSVKRMPGMTSLAGGDDRDNEQQPSSQLGSEGNSHRPGPEPRCHHAQKKCHHRVIAKPGTRPVTKITIASLRLRLKSKAEQEQNWTLQPNTIRVELCWHVRRNVFDLQPKPRGHGWVVPEAEIQG